MKNQLSLTALLIVGSVLFSPIQISAIEYRSWASTFRLISKFELRERDKQRFFQIKKKLKKAESNNKGWLILGLVVLILLTVLFASLTGFSIAGGFILGSFGIFLLFGLLFLGLVFLCVKGIIAIMRKLRKLKEEAMKVENQ